VTSRNVIDIYRSFGNNLSVMSTYEIFIPLKLGMQIFWVVMLNGRFVDFKDFWGNDPYASSSVAVSWIPTLQMKALGFLFKTSAILNPASHHNNAQDVKLQPTKLQNLKSQKSRNFDTHQFGK